MTVRDERLARAKLIQYFDLRTFSHPCAVTLTMKKRSQGEANDPIKASRNFRHFVNRLSCSLLGSAAKRYGRRIQTIPVVERNAEGRLHYHAAIDRPPHVLFADFEGAIRLHWQRTQFGYHQIDVQHHADAGWIKYMLKSRQKDSLRDDSIDWDNCHIYR
jgi:hypothetical protein